MTTPARTAQPSVDEAAISKFRDGLTGQLLRPDDGGYDEARTLWNVMIDKRPALIARCANSDDVVRSVRFAREHDLVLAVRGGGHSIAGNCVCDGGLMIDFSAMTDVEVDPEKRVARAGPGCKLGGFDAKTQEFGLATTMGIATDTGVGGLTLGGGYGWLLGKHGLACDNLIAAEVVTAAGEIVRASETENADLLWGLRGGGGNFGVVTSFEFKLHQVGPVLAGMVIYPRSAEALRFYDEFATACGDDVSTACLLLTAPDGTPAIAFLACHSGSVDDGERAVAPLRTFSTPIVDMIEPRSYVETQAMTDEAWPPGLLYYWRSSLIRTIDQDAADTLIEHAAKLPTPQSVIYFQQLHGAASRVGAEDTAFPHRFYHYNCGAMLEATDPGDVQRGIDWARETWDALQQFAERRVYVNDLGDEGDERVRDAYGPNYDRLLALKKSYDPDNVFRLNQNIKPTA